MTEQEKREKIVEEFERFMQEYDRDIGFTSYESEVLNGVHELLKARLPVRPVTGLWDRDIQLFNCGACGGEIGAGGIAKYCFHCGKAVKWK